MDDRCTFMPEIAPLLPGDKHEIQELHRSLTALKEFTTSLALVIESMISRREDTMSLPSRPSTDRVYDSGRAYESCGTFEVEQVGHSGDDAEPQAAWHPYVRAPVPIMEPASQDLQDMDDIPLDPRSLEPFAIGRMSN